MMRTMVRRGKKKENGKQNYNKKVRKRQKEGLH